MIWARSAPWASSSFKRLPMATATRSGCWSAAPPPAAPPRQPRPLPAAAAQDLSHPRLARPAPHTRPAQRRLSADRHSQPAHPAGEPRKIRARPAGGAGRDSWWGLVLDTGFMMFGLPYPVSKKIGGGIRLAGGQVRGSGCRPRKLWRVAPCPSGASQKQAGMLATRGRDFGPALAAQPARGDEGRRRRCGAGDAKNLSDAPLVQAPFGVATGGRARCRGLAPG